MFWKNKEAELRKIPVGQIKVFTRFILFPRTFNGITKWLCFSDVVYIMKRVMNYESMDYGYHREWVPLSWGEYWERDEEEILSIVKMDFQGFREDDDNYCLVTE